MSCKYIQKRIDEADKPDLLPFDVSEHIGVCVDCQRFATERTALRALVAAGSRVTAPMNFDAVLKARLAEVKTRRSFWWLGSPALLRLGAATAGVVVAVFVVQFTGLFSNNVETPERSPLSEAAPRPVPAPFVNPHANPAPPPVTIAGARDHANTKPSRLRRSGIPVESAMPASFMTAEDGGVVLLRGRNGDMDVQMPTVSVGAQPLLYVTAGQRTTRTVGTSF
ncbi:MAG TPA: hypothetical protein VFF31_05425 [Blastocatellia bacterium]|nr:hypothetical protein [Blastocatellia bacterium]